MAKLALQGSNVFSYTFAPTGGTSTGFIITANNNPIFNIGGESWTAEFWIKSAGIYSSENAIFGRRGATGSYSYYGGLRDTSGYLFYYNGALYSSTARVVPNTWNHVAYVFNQGANLRIFLNGSNVLTTTAVTSVTNTDAMFQIGSVPTQALQYYGDISNFRMIKGQAIYSGESFVVSNLPSQLPNNAIGSHASGANVAASLTGNVIFLTCNDQYLKTNGNTVLNGFASVGDVTFHGVESKELQNFSYYYPGNTNSGQNGTVLVTSTTNSLNLNGDFTIETWYYPTNNTGVVIERGLGGVGGNNASYVILWDSPNNQLNFASSNANGNTYSVGSLTGAAGNIGNPTINAWNHIAVTHTGTTYRGFLNGNLNLSITTNANVPYGALGRGVTIGGMFQTGQTYATGIPSNTISGYISNMRIIRGNSVYNAAFTPSNTSQLGNVTNTVLLTGLTPTFEDLSGVHTLATNGMSQINISTLSPIQASSVISTNAANVSITASNFGIQINRIYNKVDYNSFGMQTTVFPGTGVLQGRIYNKVDYDNFKGMQVNIYYAIGANQGRVYDKFDIANFAYLPSSGGSVISPNYQFWS